MSTSSNILGVRVSAINMGLALETIDGWIRRREENYVCVTGVHGIVESYRRDDLRKIHNGAGLVVPDGMPLVWLSRMNGYPWVNRVYGPDLMLALCELSLQKGYKHFLYGGGPGVPELLAERLTERFPGLNIADVYSPPFRVLSAAEDEAISERIRQSGAEVVWVGLSTPKQELWMAQHIKRLKPAVLIGVGAAFDFHAGLKKQAPRWMMRSGLEWLFRLGCEPVRLGPRYLRNNPLFVCLLMQQMLRIRIRGASALVSDR